MTEEDKEFLKQLKASDDKAWMELLARLQPKLESLFDSLFPGDEEKRDDITAEVLIRVVHAIVPPTRPQ